MSRWGSVTWGAVLGMALWSSCSCEHDLITETAASLKVGNVVCADGAVLSYEQFQKTNKEAVGVVYEVEAKQKDAVIGYAVYIHELDPVAFADSLGVDQNTSASVEEKDGNVNTYALFHTEEVNSPLALKSFDLWHYGQSTYVPSVKQLAQLYRVRHFVNQRIAEVGGTPLSLEPGACWLWSSTEVKGQKEDKAWLFSMYACSILETPKNQAHRFRPVISIYDVK